MAFKTPIVFSIVLLVSGCTQGPSWVAGKFSPWAPQKWKQESDVADTLFEKKQRLSQAVEIANQGTLNQKETAARQLTEVIRRDPILLLRLHAIRLIGQLDCPTAQQTLLEASHDHNSEVRISVVKAWENKPSELAVPALQEILGSDTDVDVRLAATRALGEFSGEQAVKALALALNDSDPALQLRAAESLSRVTGENLGNDMVAWKNYLTRYQASSQRDFGTEQNDTTSIAKQPKSYDLR